VHLRNIICYDGVDDNIKQLAAGADIRLFDWTELLLSMQNEDIAIQEPVKEDTYILSYTSGSTGDPKGVKLTHLNILTSVETVITRVPTEGEQVAISYLPLPHSFE